MGVSITVEVLALPPTAAAGYPYQVGQQETEKMTFLYNPKKDLWGEMDYSTAHKLIATVSRDGASWVLAKEGQLVPFDHATVRVTKLVGTSSFPGPDGVKHRFALEVVPTEITAKEAGYLNPDGWVTFRLGKPVVIGFSFTEAVVAARTP